MNEEEKQAIDWLKEELDDEKKSCKNCNYSYKGVTGLYGNNEVEIALKLIEKQQKEIEELNKENTRQQELIGNIHQKWKDKIRKKIDLIDKEYAETIEKNKNDLYLVNINAHRHSAMQSILEELLGE